MHGDRVTPMVTYLLLDRTCVIMTTIHHCRVCRSLEVIERENAAEMLVGGLPAPLLDGVEHTAMEVKKLELQSMNLQVQTTPTSPSGRGGGGALIHTHMYALVCGASFVIYCTVE